MGAAGLEERWWTRAGKVRGPAGLVGAMVMAGLASSWQSDEQPHAPWLAGLTLRDAMLWRMFLSAPGPPTPSLPAPGPLVPPSG